MFMESRMIRYRPDSNKPASTTAGAIHYLMLVKVAGKDTETVINALIALGHIVREGQSWLGAPATIDQVFAAGGLPGR